VPVPPEAAAVIVHYRTPELTIACLEALGPASMTLELETVVIDNGSGDGSANEVEARSPGTKIVRLPENRGFAAGVNAGFAQSAAPIVVLLNPDTRPEPESVTRLVEHLHAHPEAGVAAPILVNPDGSFQRSAHRRFPTLLTTFITFCAPFGYLFAWLPWHPHELTEAESFRGGPVAHVTGAALAVRRAAYADAGPLDEGFFLYLEETEWQRRLRGTGWRIDLVPSARVMHLIQSGRSAAETPSPRYLPSLYRYMELRGVPENLVDVTLLAATSISYAYLWAAGRLFAQRRGASDRLLPEYGAYLDYVRERRRARTSAW
jgi:N-acetylglucosaminyl-diphospho-decaprenol L-rhamnosyltransferase